MISKVHQFLKRSIDYVQGKLTDKQFLIFSSILVGLSAGLAAVVLKFFVHYINITVTNYADSFRGFFVFTLLPIVGIAITVLFIRFVLRNRLKRGSAEIVYAIAKKSSNIAPEEMYAHVATSAVTVGFGGSVGLESPMVSTGAAIGSNYAQSYKLNYKERTILLACGASAGIAAAFNSPIAGVLFAIEVILADVTASAFLPLIIAAASGALISKIVLQESVLLTFSLQQPFDYVNVPYYIVLGILAGFVSLYYAYTYTWIEHKMEAWKNPVKRVLLGGVILCALLILFPPLFGEGYESIKTLSHLRGGELIRNSLLQGAITNEWMLLVFLGLLAFVKVIATAVTIGSGGNGGNFGPALFVGAYLGYSFSKLVNMLGLGPIPENNFTLVAMAGILSGIFYSPLTGIFLIAEITGGYGLMIPLMIVAAFSSMVVRYFEPLSMEAKRLSTKLKLSTENRDKYLLSKLDLSEMIEDNFTKVSQGGTLRDLVTAVSQSKRNTYPVLNKENQLVGLVYLDNVRDIIFKTEKYDNITIEDIMSKPEGAIHPNESLHTVLKKFDDTNQWNLPVVENDKYVGFVSKSSILAKYRTELLKSV
ncbi:MAG: chloride channel protein [Bacteroidia bacterium]|nr:chloride channel protein [Bacteroidia bacterium]